MKAARTTGLPRMAADGGLLGAVAIFAAIAMGAEPNGPRFCDPLRGLNSAERARFRAGKEGFEEVEAVADGIGPVFNDVSCVACHDGPATGGGSDILSTRFGRITDGKFDDMKEFGGPTIQKRGIGRVGAVEFVGEVVPPKATIVSRRRATPLFGLGLVDAVPDQTLHDLAANQRANSPATAGRPNLTRNLRTGQLAVGKFGWKAQLATLFDFSGDAYKDEMGITVAGFTVFGFPGVFPFFRSDDARLLGEENPPQGDGTLLAYNPVGSPNEPDDEDLIGFTDFMTFLAPPPRGPATRRVWVGAGVFQGIGCASCHTPTLQTGLSPVRALNYVTFQPFSDFLLHDMGSLGDGISGAGEEGVARGGEMRTAPLWGLRALPSLLHDGRAETVEQAILMHAGQGRMARDRFAELDARQKSDLLTFLNSL